VSSTLSYVLQVKVDHYAKECRNLPQKAPIHTSACITPTLCAIQPTPKFLAFGVVNVFVQGKQLSALTLKVTELRELKNY